LSEYAQAERVIMSVKDGSKATYHEAFRVSLTDNIDPSFCISELSIMLMMLSVFQMDIKNNKNEAHNEQINYMMSTVREYLYKQIHYKQHVSILEVDLKVKIKRKTNVVGLHSAFKDSVDNGRFFMMTPLHCEMYNKGLVDKE
jgi:hypothetical protein